MLKGVSDRHSVFVILPFNISTVHSLPKSLTHALRLEPCALSPEPDTGRSAKRLRTLLGLHSCCALFRSPDPSGGALPTQLHKPHLPDCRFFGMHREVLSQRYYHPYHSQW